jgi:signal transduction histidine kinase
VPVATLIERARDRLTNRAEQADMKLAVTGLRDAGEAAPLQVHADPQLVEQILLNLVDNACKYAGSAARREITLAIDPGAQRVRFDVRDNGPGVPSSQVRRLFTPFRKSAREAARSAPGVGLGLALSRRLARSMRGDLELVERAGAGACFRLSLRRVGG